MLKTACATGAGLIIVGGLSASAQTVLWSDNWNAANGNFDNATTPTGLFGSSIVPESTGNELTINNNTLQIQDPYTDAPGIRFQNTSSYGNGLVDWSAGSLGSTILAAGGFNISFTFTAPENVNDGWVSVGVGEANDTSFEVVNGSTASGLLISQQGLTSIFHNGGNGGTGNSFSDASLTHSLSISYYFNSWAAGSSVVADLDVDGSLVDTQNFTWNGGANYISVNAHPTQSGESETIVSPLTFSTVPEPGSWAMMAGGSGLLVVIRRLRRARA